MPEGIPSSLPIPLPLPRRRRVVYRDADGNIIEADSIIDAAREAARRRSAGTGGDSASAQPVSGGEGGAVPPDVPQPVTATPEPTISRQQRRADRQAARLERREARRVARSARQPRTLPPGLFQVLGGLFGGGPVPTAQPSRYPTPGEIRTQAARATPVSLLGNIGTVLGSALAARAARPVAQQPLPTVPFRSLTGMGMTAARGAGRLVSLPGAGAMRTGGQFGVGIPNAAGLFRKRKRTNPTNVRALRRALSRVEGFIKIEKRVDKILRRMAPKARAAQKVGFVKRRR